MIKKDKLTIFEIFNLSAAIYKKNFRFLSIATIVVFLPISILNLAVPFPTENLSELASMDTDKINELLVYAWTVIAINVTFSPLFISASTYVAKRHIEGRAPELQGVMEVTLFKWGKLILTGAMYVSAVAVGSLLLIPGFFLAVAFNFFPNLFAVRGEWGIKCFIESYKLVKGRWIRTAGFLFLINFLSLVVSVFVQQLLSLVFMILSGILPEVVSYVALTLLTQIAAMYFTVCANVWFLNRYYLSGAGGEPAAPQAGA